MDGGITLFYKALPAELMRIYVCAFIHRDIGWFDRGEQVTCSQQEETVNADRGRWMQRKKKQSGTQEESEEETEEPLKSNPERLKKNGEGKKDPCSCCSLFWRIRDALAKWLAVRGLSKTPEVEVQSFSFISQSSFLPDSSAILQSPRGKKILFKENRRDFVEFIKS